MENERFLTNSNQLFLNNCMFTKTKVIKREKCENLCHVKIVDYFISNDLNDDVLKVLLDSFQSREVQEFFLHLFQRIC